MGTTIAEPAPGYIDKNKLGRNEYVIGGSSVRDNFGTKAIYIKSDSIATINKCVSNARNSALEYPDCQFYATRTLVFMLLCVVDWCVKEMGKRNQTAE